MYFFILNTIICLLSILVVNKFLSKIYFLIDKPEFSQHKLPHKKIIPLSGGIYFYITLFFISFFNVLNTKIFIYLLPLLIIGIIADTKKDFNPNLRLFLQIFFLLGLTQIIDLRISSIDLDFFDNLLKNKFFNIFFVVFCLVTVLNGYNFMDGLNGFVGGQILLILLSIFSLYFVSNLTLDYNIYLIIKSLLPVLILFFIFNLFGLCFLGDNGTYIFSIVISYIVIVFINSSNNQISPILGASYLWYPAFENLYTILRRAFNKKKISQPDKLHLHTLLYSFLIKKYKSEKLIKFNSISSISINIMLVPGLILSTIWFNKSFNLMMLVLIQVSLYILLHRTLVKLNK